MDNNQLIEQVETFARPFCDQCSDDPNLWKTHVQLVRKYALMLAEIEVVDSQVIEFAALLHDIGRYKGQEEHNLRSYELSKQFLETIDLPEGTKGLILECVLKHSTRYSSSDNKIEVRVLQSADALATLFDEDLQEYSRRTMPKETINQLHSRVMRKISLDSARRIAEPQIAKLKALLN